MHATTPAALTDVLSGTAIPDSGGLSLGPGDVRMFITPQ